MSVLFRNVNRNWEECSSQVSEWVAEGTSNEMQTEHLEQQKLLPRLMICGGCLDQNIVRIKVFDCCRGDELVVDKDCRRNGLLGQNIEAELHQIGTIMFGEKSDRADESRVRFADFGSPLRRCVLAHNGAAFRLTGFFKRPQST